jgi:hypothetical protein
MKVLVKFRHVKFHPELFHYRDGDASIHKCELPAMLARGFKPLIQGSNTARAI